MECFACELQSQAVTPLCVVGHSHDHSRRGNVKDGCCSHAARCKSDDCYVLMDTRRDLLECFSRKGALSVRWCLARAIKSVSG